jgi:hypothetical protein
LHPLIRARSGKDNIKAKFRPIGTNNQSEPVRAKETKIMIANNVIQPATIPWDVPINGQTIAANSIEMLEKMTYWQIIQIKGAYFIDALASD